jgi:G3E family GTPase
MLTGFLGSGKTTLLNRLLRAPDMARTLVVVNEFGEVGIDHQLVEASADAIVLLENGCLCCSVRGDLVQTLDDLHRRKLGGEIPTFDRVTMETSGLADPGAVIQAFLSEPSLAARYRLDSVIATVDAVNGPATLAAHTESVRQAALADEILITKADLLGERAGAAEAALRARLREINPAARIERAERVDLAAAIRNRAFDSADPGSDPRPWLNAAAYRHGDTADRDHDELAHAGGRIESFCILRDEPVPLRTLELILDALTQNLGPRLLRVKGLVHVAEEPERPAVIQGAQQLLHTMTWLDRWPDADRRTRIVLITEGAGGAVVDSIFALVERIGARTAYARSRSQMQ